MMLICVIDTILVFIFMIFHKVSPCVICIYNKPLLLYQFITNRKPKSTVKYKKDFKCRVFTQKRTPQLLFGGQFLLNKRVFIFLVEKERLLGGLQQTRLVSFSFYLLFVFQEVCVYGKYRHHSILLLHLFVMGQHVHVQ